MVSGRQINRNTRFIRARLFSECGCLNFFFWLCVIAILFQALVGPSNNNESSQLQERIIGKWHSGNGNLENELEFMDDGRFRMQIQWGRFGPGALTGSHTLNDDNLILEAGTQELGNSGVQEPRTLTYKIALSADKLTAIDTETGKELVYFKVR
jgi:hypothetical protein